VEGFEGPLEAFALDFPFEGMMMSSCSGISRTWSS
jgi:hypothetical protein